ncbi:MAG: PQQ-dependent sugar dehydrogenase, partial [Luteolibacter sp.]
ASFIDLDSIVTPRANENFIAGGEEGLLGLAFHPSYNTNRRFFVFYTVSIGGIRHQRLSEFAASTSNPNRADPDSEKVILQMPDDAGNHNGGDVHFGPDGYLYVSLGDEGNQDDNLNNSQLINKDFWSGMIRIDVNVNPADYDHPSNPNLRPNPHPAIVLESGNPRYKVPADNPWVGATLFNGISVAATSVRSEFYAVGLRNPWRFSFDPATGDLWCGDVGGGAWEEINVITRGGNYGWAFREGNESGPKWNLRPTNWSGAIAPVHAYAHGSGPFQGNSVTGGVIYHGTRIPSLTGKYLFADYSSGNIWSLDPATSPATVERIAGEGNIAGFGVDPSNGDILIADLDGQIRRLTEQSLDTNFPGTLAATGLFSDVATLTPSTGLVEYQVNLPFWSDHAKKRRWFGLPDLVSKIGYQREGSWNTPAGMIWVKHFDLETTRDNPATSKRLETRVFVRNSTGAYGVSYRWNNEGTSATLANAAGEEFDLTIDDDGSISTQRWRIPSRSECMTCHSPQAGHSLSFETRQLNRQGQIGNRTGNFLQLLSDTGYLDGLTESPTSIPRHLAIDDTNYSLEARARAYLDVNCSYCHQPGGTAPTAFDSRVETPLFSAQLVNAISTAGLHPSDRLLVPGQQDRSIIIHRAAARNGYTRMPPLGSNVIDQQGVQLLMDWIQGELPPSRQSFQSWQIDTLGSRPLADQLPDADPDGDGRSNRREFLEYTQPLVPDSGAPALTSSIGGNFKLTLPHLPGRSMLVETSTNLGSWEIWQAEGNNGLERASGFPLTLETPITQEARFFRTKIQER